MTAESNEIAGATVVKAKVPSQTVAIVEGEQTRPYQSQQDQKRDASLPADTTFQQDLVTAGQRRINLIWEYTQAAVAIMVVVANMIVGVWDGLQEGDSVHPFPVILSSSLFLIVGFYFSRTNHSAIGGVGPKAQDNYSGR